MSLRSDYLLAGLTDNDKVESNTSGKQAKPIGYDMDDSILQALGKGFMSAAGNAIHTINDAKAYAGVSEKVSSRPDWVEQNITNDPISKFGRELEDEYQPNYKPLSSNSVAAGVGGLFPYMAGLGALGVLASRTGQYQLLGANALTAATRLGLPSRAALFLSEAAPALTYGAIEKVPESLVERQSAYDDYIREAKENGTYVQGETEYQANRVADKVMQDNIALLTTTGALEQFSLGRIGKSKGAKTLLKGLLGNVAINATEEYGQQIFPKMEAGKEWHWDDVDNLESALVGAFSGAGMHGAGVATDRLLDRFSNANVDGGESDTPSTPPTIGDGEVTPYNMPTQGEDITAQVGTLKSGWSDVLPQIGGILKNQFGVDAEISSAGRSEEHNAEVGGAENSYHIVRENGGDAVDIVLPDNTPQETLDKIEQYFKQTGMFDEVLFHDVGSGNHLHLGGLRGGASMPQVGNGGGIDAFMSAIMGQESGGNYGAVNADSGASGAFQIMPENWPAWAEAAGLGADAPMTPENQDYVARHKMQEYYNQFGNWRDVAIAWYAGPEAVGWSEEAKNRNQDGYPSVNEYADSVMARMGAAPSAQNASFDANAFLAAAQDYADSATGEEAAAVTNYFRNMFDDAEKGKMPTQEQMQEATAKYPRILDMMPKQESAPTMPAQQTSVQGEQRQVPTPQDITIKTDNINRAREAQTQSPTSNFTPTTPQDVQTETRQPSPVVQAPTPHGMTALTGPKSANQQGQQQRVAENAARQEGTAQAQARQTVNNAVQTAQREGAALVQLARQNNVPLTPDIEQALLSGNPQVVAAAKAYANSMIGGMANANQLPTQNISSAPAQSGEAGVNQDQNTQPQPSAAEPKQAQVNPAAQESAQQEKETERKETIAEEKKPAQNGSEEATAAKKENVAPKEGGEKSAQTPEETKKALADLANAAWDDTSVQGKVSFAPSQKLRDKVKELFGHDINEVFITADNIRHIKNDHGTGEESRGQVDIKPEDIADIYDVVNDFESATKERDDKLGNQNILVVKGKNGKMFALLTERGKSKAEVKTVYKQKEKASPMLDAKSPSLNVQNDSGAPFVDSSVAQNRQESKREENRGTDKQAAIESFIDKVFPANGKRGDQYKNEVAQLAAIMNPKDWVKGLRKLRRDYVRQMDKILKPAMDALESGMKQGVSLVPWTDGSGRQARVSNNAPWYREFYAEHNRPPRKSELREMARQMISGDPSAPKVEGWTPTTAKEEAAMKRDGEKIAELEKYINACDAIKDRLAKEEKRFNKEYNSPVNKARRAVTKFLQSAWHGSGALFDEFDLSFLGTGEGAQAHGYGVYTSEQRRTAEGYRKRVSGSMLVVEYNGVPYTGLGMFWSAVNGDDSILPMPERFALTYVAKANGDKAKAKNELQKRLKEDRGTIYENDIEAAIDLVDNGDFTVKRKSLGALYHVEIPDNDVLLDEQKTFDEQPEKVQEALTKLFEDDAKKMSFRRTFGDEVLSGYKQMTGKEIYDALWRGLDIRNLNDWGPDDFNSRRAASELLNKYGIEGITYDGRLDGRCYVIFNDKAISILDRFEQEANQQGKGEYDIVNRLISIFKNADASTVPHELSHWFTTEQEEIAAKVPNSKIAKNLDALYKWAEWSEGDAKAFEDTPFADEFSTYEKNILDAQKNGDEAAERKWKEVWKQEKIAREFEKYLKDGKAPTRGLKGIFERFKKWLVDIYRAFTGSGMKPSKEAKKFFDSILATEDELRTGEDMSMMPSEQEAYETMRARLSEDGKISDEDDFAARLAARIAYRMSLAWRAAGEDRSAVSLLPGIVRGENEQAAVRKEFERQKAEVRKKYQGTKGWLKAPNGEDTNLTEDQWVTVRTENFIRWFGDWINDPKNASKVVDENGEPKVVYHGTVSGWFDTFKKEYGNVEGDMGARFYFTDNKADVSENYEEGGPDFENKVSRLAERIQNEEDISYTEAEEKARGQLYNESALYDVFLDIKNPANVQTTMLFTDDDVDIDISEEDYSEDERIAAEDEARAEAWDNLVPGILDRVEEEGFDADRGKLSDVFYEALYEGGINIPALKEKLNDLYIEDDEGNLASNEVLRIAIEELGYDGIIDPTVSKKFKGMNLDPDTTHYIVFESEQIKSSTENNGQFSGNEGNIYRQMAGEKAKTADKSAMNKAISMEKSGKNPVEIYMETGWIKGKEGKWRFEVPDDLNRMNLSVLRDKDTATLEEVYDNPALYMAYPFLRRAKIAVVDDLADDVWGAASNRKLEINRKKLFEKNRHWEVKRTIIHEIQHLIQRHEKFAAGGDADTIREELGDLVVTDKDIAKMSDDELYSNLAGEQEARKTEDRASLFSRDKDVREADRRLKNAVALLKAAEKRGDKAGIRAAQDEIGKARLAQNAALHDMSRRMFPAYIGKAIVVFHDSDKAYVSNRADKKQDGRTSPAGKDERPVGEKAEEKYNKTRPERPWQDGNIGRAVFDKYLKEGQMESIRNIIDREIASNVDLAKISNLATMVDAREKLKPIRIMDSRFKSSKAQNDKKMMDLLSCVLEYARRCFDNDDRVRERYGVSVGIDGRQAGVYGAGKKIVPKGNGRVLGEGVRGFTQGLSASVGSERNAAREHFIKIYNEMEEEKHLPGASAFSMSEIVANAKDGTVTYKANLNRPAGNDLLKGLEIAARYHGGHFSRKDMSAYFRGENATDRRDDFEKDGTRILNGNKELATNMAHGESNRKSLDTEAFNRSKEELRDEILEAFTGAKVKDNGDHLTLTMKNGVEIAVDLVDQIVTSEDELARAKEEHGLSQDTEATVGGTAKALDNKAFVELAKTSHKGTGFHEAFHLAYDMLLTDKEKAAVRHVLGEGNKNGKTFEERAADAYANWKQERAAGRGTALGKLWQKITDFARKMKALFAGDTMQDVFRKVEQGDVWNREAQKGTGETHYSVERANKLDQDNIDKAAKKAASRIEVREKKDKNSMSLGDRYLWSPSRIAERHPELKPFFDFADKAMKKLTKLREEWGAELSSALDMAKDKDGREQLYDILWQGDTEGKNYTDDELRAMGASDSVIKAYKSVRSLMDKVYEALNDARRRPQTVTKTLSDSEVEDLKKNPFVIKILSDTKTEDGKHKVTWREYKNWEKDYIVDEATYEKFKKDDSIQILSEKKLRNGEYALHVRESISPLTNRQGYIPHFFHDFRVIVSSAEEQKKLAKRDDLYKKLEKADTRKEKKAIQKEIDALTDEIAADREANTDSIVGSFRTLGEAMKFAKEQEKKLPEGAKIIISPKTFNFKALGQDNKMLAAVLGDKDYDRVMRSIAANTDLTVAEAKEVIDARKKGRHRFNGNFLQRKGYSGFVKDMEWVLRHHVNNSARYVAMETEFKPQAINLFERMYGDFRHKYDGLADYIQDYINDVNGVPSALEKSISDALNRSDFWRKYVIPRYGDRAALTLAGNISGAVSIAKLGLFNVSSAMLNLTQLANAAAYIGDWNVLWNGLRRGAKGIYGKYSPRDQRVLDETGVAYDIGLDSGGGYDRFRPGKLAAKSMWFFKTSEETVRRGTVLAAYDAGIKRGMSHEEAIRFADEVNRKSNFEYGVQDAPNMFRRGSIISQLLFQFKKYPIKELEVMRDMLSSQTNAKQKAIFWGTYFFLAGLFQFPFGEWFEELAELIGLKPGPTLKKWIMKTAGDDPVKKAIAEAAMYGGLAPTLGIDISQRYGLGGVLPTDLYLGKNPSTLDLIGSLGGASVSTAKDLYRLLGAAVRLDADEALATLKGISPGIANAVSAYSGKTYDKRGRVASEYNTPKDRILKALGFRSADEAITSDIRSLYYDEKDEKTREKQRAIDRYIDNPTTENATRLRELGVKPATVKKAKQQRKMDNLKRTEANMSKEEKKAYQELMKFAK